MQRQCCCFFSSSKIRHARLHAYGGLWIRLHGLPEFLSSPPLRGVPNTNFGRPWLSLTFFPNKIDCRTNCKAESNIDSRTNKHHHNDSLKLIEFETYYIKPNPPLFFLPTKHAIVSRHGPFSLHTMHEGPWLHKTTFPTLMVRPLDERQGPSLLQGHGQCSRLKSSMPFKHDLALQNIPLSKQPYKTQPQIENEDITGSPQYNMHATRTNKRRALSLQETESHGRFLILHIVPETCTIWSMHKFNIIIFVFHFYIVGLTSWIWTNPLIERLKFESSSKWN